MSCNSRLKRNQCNYWVSSPRQVPSVLRTYKNLPFIIHIAIRRSCHSYNKHRTISRQNSWLAIYNENIAYQESVLPFLSLLIAVVTGKTPLRSRDSWDTVYSTLAAIERELRQYKLLRNVVQDPAVAVFLLWLCSLFVYLFLFSFLFLYHVRRPLVQRS